MEDQSITESKNLRMGSDLQFCGPIISLRLSHSGASCGRKVLLMRKGRSLQFLLISPSYIP